MKSQREMNPGHLWLATTATLPPSLFTFHLITSYSRFSEH